MLTATKKHKKTIIMYEVSDKKTYSGTDESDTFKDFIRSMGFKVENYHENGYIYRDSETIVVDGVKMKINYSKAPYYAKSAYSSNNAYTVRKDRCLELLTEIGSERLIAKVSFNVEIDRDKLHAKIAGYVKERKDFETSIVTRKENEAAELDKMQRHYYNLNSPTANTIVKSIMVHKGKLSFHTDLGTINIDAETSKLINFEAATREPMATTKSIMAWIVSIDLDGALILKLISEIQKTGAIGGTFTEFAKSAYHQSVQPY